jgi:hypothetical protein
MRMRMTFFNIPFSQFFTIFYLTKKYVSTKHNGKAAVVRNIPYAPVINEPNSMMGLGG